MVSEERLKRSDERLALLAEGGEIARHAEIWRQVAIGSASAAGARCCARKSIIKRAGTHRPAVLVLTVTSGDLVGSNHTNWAGAMAPAIPMNSGLLGQVGQESYLHPAVVEPAAVRLAAFREVHEQA